jgi:hypothetical protein
MLNFCSVILISKAKNKHPTARTLKEFAILYKSPRILCDSLIPPPIMDSLVSKVLIGFSASADFRMFSSIYRGTYYGRSA